MQCLNCLFQEQVCRGITIHAGEATGGAAANICKAVDDYSAIRIGHGYKVFDDFDNIIDHCGRAISNRPTPAGEKNKVPKLHFEQCPSSSFYTGGFPKTAPWPQHPLRLLYEKITAKYAFGDKIKREDRSLEEVNAAVQSMLLEMDETNRWDGGGILGFVRSLPITVGCNTDDPSVIPDCTLNGEWDLCLNKMGLTPFDMKVMTYMQLDSCFLGEEAKLSIAKKLDAFYAEYEGKILMNATRKLSGELSGVKLEA